MPNDPAELTTPAWQSVLLLCKDCRKRSNGPQGLKAKAVAAEVKKVARDTKPRPRVVLTACLGICPKGAMALAVAGGAGTRVARVRTLAQAAPAAATLLASPAGH